jgi:hypothetical protein
MMIPIYFPFTYIPTAALTIFQNLFKSVTVYQPSSLNIPGILLGGKKSDFIDLRIPLKMEESKLDAVLKDFRSWAKIHRESQMDFLKVQRDKIPFYEEFSASQIKADIKKSGAVTAPDLLFNARLFLQTAQEFDRYHDELNQELVSLDKAEQDLHENLKGEKLAHSEEYSTGNKAGNNYPPDYMILERLRAWTHLFLCDRIDTDPENLLFITTGRAALDILVDGRAEKVKKVLCLRNIPMEAKDIPKIKQWRDSLGKRLKELAEKGGNESVAENLWGPEDNEISGKAALTVYLVIGESPYELFLRTAGISKPGVGKESSANGTNNTLIGLISVL